MVSCVRKDLILSDFLCLRNWNESLGMFYIAKSRSPSRVAKNSSELDLVFQ